NWSPVGLGGYAFLESPGISFKADGSPHGVDDDQDGITDELRDNDAGTRIAGADNIKASIQSHYNVQNFLRFYNLQSLDDLPAVQQGYWWTGDENANWRRYLDVNTNGIHDAGEPLNNDVGSDGLGPYDAAYTGPDPDGSEGDGKPEQGEPNFGRLDKDESDQIGLTGFTIFPVHFYELHDDEQNWTVLTTKTDPASVLPQNNVNLAMYFAAGARPSGGFPGNLFPLKQLQTERFSMALLFGIDKNDLVRRKQTVQQIYNANYTFATPPDKPIVIAVAGDRKVTLYWDDKAERSFDRFLQKFDFEGYRIYKSTEPSFLENLTITDAYGKATFHKPVAQYDLVDSIKGLHPLDINGVKFDLGTDSGLRHSFVDTDVQNGQTYYYAVVSYDQGFYTRTVAGTEAGITPSESPAIIRADLSGNVKLDVNTATVTPRAPSAGYVAPAIEGQILHAGPGTGHIDMRILNPDSVRDGHAYRVTFSNPTQFQSGNTPTFSMTDETSGKLLFSDRKVISAGEEMPIVNGMIGYVFNDATVDILGNQTKWIAGTQNTITNVALNPSYTTTNIAYPADYEVRFSQDISDTSVTGLFFGAPPATPVKFTVWNTTENKKTKFLFFDENNDGAFNFGDKVVLLAGDSLGALPGPGHYRTTWTVSLFRDTTQTTVKFPAAGDKFQIVTTKPFRTGESFQFTTKSGVQNNDLAKNNLGNIVVVPNPYVGAASWEPSNPYRSGRGTRTIYFTNLPARCSIRIYTVRGNLVQTIEHSGTVDNGQEAWNLVSKDGMDVVYGVYVFHVDAPGIGKTIGRFAIIK
ncbi:MAG TPA: hypothetical protein VK470_11965, partial [Bacteroidota bacterium]|nr:hypothetical protein [Bacteroidota bacterium]